MPTLRSGDFLVFSLRRIGSTSTRKRRLPHRHLISSMLLPLLPGLSFAITLLIFEDMFFSLGVSDSLDFGSDT